MVSRGFETVATFQYQQFQASNDLAYGRGSFLDAMRETARVFDWSWRSPFGLFTYASFFVQMATGILVGFVVGRRGWPKRPLADAGAERRALRTALLIAIGCGLIEAHRASASGGEAGLFTSALARTIGRASLAACYALVVVRIVRDHRELPRWLRPLRDAGRMPLSNYLLQTALATFVFYGWGLGFWNSAGAGRGGRAGGHPLRRGPAAAQPPLAQALSLRAARIPLAPLHVRLGAALSENASASSA